MKTTILLLVLLLSSCSTYVKLHETHTSAENIKAENKFLNGSYSNYSSSHVHFWNTLLQQHTAPDSLGHLKKETIQLTALSNNVLQAKFYDENKVMDSIYISGVFKESTFVFKKKRTIGIEAPVFWTYDINKLKLKLNAGNELYLSERGISLIFLTVIPIMGADGNEGNTYEKIK